MRETIDVWIADDGDLPKLDYGKILSIELHNDVAAMAVFDCAGVFLDTYQMIELDGEWRISKKFYVDR